MSHDIEAAKERIITAIRTILVQRGELPNEITNDMRFSELFTVARDLKCDVEITVTEHGTGRVVTKFR